MAHRPNGSREARHAQAVIDPQPGVHSNHDPPGPTMASAAADAPSAATIAQTTDTTPTPEQIRTITNTAIADQIQSTTPRTDELRKANGGDERALVGKKNDRSGKRVRRDVVTQEITTNPRKGHGMGPVIQGGLLVLIALLTGGINYRAATALALTPWETWGIAAILTIGVTAAAALIGQALRKRRALWSPGVITLLAIAIGLEVVAFVLRFQWLQSTPSVTAYTSAAWAAIAIGLLSLALLGLAIILIMSFDVEHAEREKTERSLGREIDDLDEDIAALVVKVNSQRNLLLEEIKRMATEISLTVRRAGGEPDQKTVMDALADGMHLSHVMESATTD